MFDFLLFPRFLLFPFFPSFLFLPASPLLLFFFFLHYYFILSAFSISALNEFFHYTYFKTCVEHLLHVQMSDQQPLGRGARRVGGKLAVILGFPIMWSPRA